MRIFWIYDFNVDNYTGEFLITQLNLRMSKVFNFLLGSHIYFRQLRYGTSFHLPKGDLLTSRIHFAPFMFSWQCKSFWIVWRWRCNFKNNSSLMNFDGDSYWCKSDLKLIKRRFNKEIIIYFKLGNLGIIVNSL